MDNQTLIEYLVLDNSTDTLTKIGAAHNATLGQVEKSVKSAADSWAAFDKAETQSTQQMQYNFAATASVSKGYLDAAKNTSIFDNSTQQAQKSSEHLGSSLGSVRSGIIGLSAGAFLGEEAMTQLGGGAMKAANGLEVARSAMHLFALAIIDPTPLGIAATAIGVLVGALQAQQKQMEAELKPSQDLQKSIDDLGDAHTPLGKQIQTVIGLSGVEADAWALAATKSDIVATAIRDQAKAHEELIRSQQQNPFLKGIDAQPGGEFALETPPINSAMVAISDLRDAENSQALSAYAAKKATQEKVDILNEQNRVLGILAPNIAKLNEEYAKEQATLKDLAQAHDKNIGKLKDEAKAAQAASVESGIKNTENEAKQEASAWTAYYKQLTALDYSYAQSVTAQLHQRGLLERDEARSISDLWAQNAKDLETINREATVQQEMITRDAAGQEQGAHTFAEVLKIRATEELKRQEAVTAAELRRKEAADKVQEGIAAIAQKKADQNEEFAYQKRLADDALAHNRQLAQENRDAQIEAAQAAARIQATAIQDTLTKTIAAIDKRKTEEDAAYKDSTLKAKAAYAEQKKALLDTGTAADQLNLKIQSMYSSLDRDVIKALELRDALIQASGVSIPAFSSYGSYKHASGIGFAEGTGGWQTVPSGFSNDSFPIGLSSGEKFNIQPASAPASSGETAFYNYGTIIGEADFRRWIQSEMNHKDRGL